MSKYQRNKGKRGEREIANLLKDAGCDSYRIGYREVSSNEDRGDIILDGIPCEVKIGKQVVSWIYKIFKNEGIDIAFVRRDREEWKVILSLDRFLELWNK